MVAKMEGEYYIMVSTDDVLSVTPNDYRLMTSFDGVAKIETESRENSKVAYEVLHNDVFKIFLDVDGLPDCDAAHVLVVEFKKFAKIKDDILYLVTENNCSRGKNQPTYHIIFNMYTYRSNMQNLVDRFKSRTNCPYAKQINSKAYEVNHLLRLPFQAHVGRSDDVHKFLYWNDRTFSEMTDQSIKIKARNLIDENIRNGWKKLSDALQSVRKYKIKDLEDPLESVVSTLVDSCSVPGTDYSDDVKNFVEKLHKLSIVQYVDGAEQYNYKWTPLGIPHPVTIIPHAQYVNINELLSW